MKNIFSIVALLTFCFAMSQDDRKAFQDLKQLEGKWVGTLNLSNGSSKSINLNYSIRSNGSALVEESNEGGVGMMTVFNLQNQKLLLTHYCAAQNRPVAEITENKNGALLFKTNHSKSDLNLAEDFFVTSFKFDLLLNDKNTFKYEYTAEGADGESYSANAVLKRVM